jgi:hypothetical protein
VTLLTQRHVTERGNERPTATPLLANASLQSEEQGQRSGKPTNRPGFTHPPFASSNGNGTQRGTHTSGLPSRGAPAAGDTRIQGRGGRALCRGVRDMCSRQSKMKKTAVELVMRLCVSYPEGAESKWRPTYRRRRRASAPPLYPTPAALPRVPPPRLPPFRTDADLPTSILDCTSSGHSARAVTGN